MVRALLLRDRHAELAVLMSELVLDPTIATSTDAQLVGSFLLHTAAAVGDDLALSSLMRGSHDRAGLSPTAASLMAPNTDSGLFGNPEENNSFVLQHDGVLLSMPWQGVPTAGGAPTLWRLSDQPGCERMLEPASKFPQVKLGYAGV